MELNGFQKLTLLDYPGHMAATLFTAGCNFRCPFCHNSFLVTDIDNSQIFHEEEILRFLDTRKGLLDGVAITGGEPTMHKDLPELIRKIKAKSFKVKLDTNGTNPRMLMDLVNEGLVDYVAMDIKNSPEKYALTVGLPSYDLSKVNESIAFLLSGTVDFEFRTTVVAEYHEVDDFDAIGKWIEGAPHYFLQQFVDSGHLISGGLHAHPVETLVLMKEKAAKYVNSAEIRGISE